MSVLKRLSLTVAIVALAFGIAHAQTPLIFMDAELAIPFGAAKGQVSLVADLMIFVSAENPKSSLSIARGDIAKIDRAGDVVTIVTRRQLRDSDGDRDTFKFRLSQPAAIMRWYETMTPAAPVTAPATSPADPAPAPRVIIASYAVKHNHTIGSCEGTLIMTEDAVNFESTNRIEDARIWKLIDIKKVEQNGIYKLKVEPFRGDSFNFELDGKGIDSTEFRQLVDRIARARAR